MALMAGPMQYSFVMRNANGMAFNAKLLYNWVGPGYRIDVTVRSFGPPLPARNVFAWPRLYSASSGGSVSLRRESLVESSSSESQ